MAEDPGVEIPKGHPDQIRQAGAGWASLGEVLHDQAGRMESAAGTVVGADWSGDASRAYAGYSAIVSAGFIGAAGSCRQVHQACRQFASDLEDAQHRARKAKHDAEDAIGRRDAARRRAADAQGRIDAAARAIDEGTIWDGISGLVNGETFGIVNLGGDKNSDRYRGGVVSSFIPISPSGVVKDIGKGGERLLAHEAEHVAEQKIFRVVTVDGRRVYQNDKIIDPLRTDRTGTTNLERMANGDPPIGPDGKPINLHHTIQTDDSPVAEVSQAFHIKYRRTLHVNWPPHRFPTGIDRPAFEKWRDGYWRQRLGDFQDRTP